MNKILLGMILATTFACGSSDSEDKNANAVDAAVSSPDAMVTAFATMSGTVWVPGNAPGMVPAGHEIPVYNAVIYVTATRPEPFEVGAHCQACTEAPAKSVQSDHRGQFTLANIIPGTYWLIIEKGAFRLEQEITIADDDNLILSAHQTTLPATDNPAAGQSIPKIAMATGIFDDLEDILGKMGLGAVDASGAFDGPSAVGVFDFYDNGGPNSNYAVETLATLVNDLDMMKNYDIIFIPCGGSDHVAELKSQQVLKNIRDYVAAGGKLYITDWSGEWADSVFPEQIELGGSAADTPGNAYNAITDTWDTSVFGNANGSPSYTSEHAQAVNEDLSLWLEGQRGPLASGGEGLIQANDLSIEGNWNRIDGLHAVTVGMDEDGNPIIDSPKKYVMGPDSSGQVKPLTVTYEPAGCGRVLYSTYHTTHNTHVGLAPQERMLVYLIMEIGVCNDSITID